MGLICTHAIAQTTPWKGQAPIKVVPTTTLPIQKQFKATFDLGQGIYGSNQFEGARLNGIARANDSLIIAMITPENTPINPRPWYAFKLWSQKSQSIYLKIIYLDGARHRYYPKLSRDGLAWNSVKEKDYFEGEIDTLNNSRGLPNDITIQIDIGPDTLWVAAQELQTSRHVFAWMDQLAEHPYITTSNMGVSREGRPIRLLKIG